MFGDSDVVELVGFRGRFGALLFLEIPVDPLDPIAAALEVVIGELASVGRARWRVMIRTTAQEGQRRAEGQGQGSVSMHDGMRDLLWSVADFPLYGAAGCSEIGRAHV